MSVVSESLSLREWLSARQPALRASRLEGARAAQLLVGSNRRWSDPQRSPLLVAGEIAEVSRTDLRMASALIQHLQATLLRSMVGAPIDPSRFDWAVLEPTWTARRAPAWTVRGCTSTWSAPPDEGVTYVVTVPGDDLLLAVPGDLVLGERSIHVTTTGRESVEVVARDAPAVVLGRLSTDEQQRAALYGRLLEAAAWYGGIAALGDRMLATLGQDPAGPGAEALQSHCADIDAMLHAAWITVRDAVHAWERGAQSPTTTGYLVARARTLVRLAASAALFSLTGSVVSPEPDEQVVRLRQELAWWMGASDTSADAGVVAGAALRRGAAW